MIRLALQILLIFVLAGWAALQWRTAPPAIDIPPVESGTPAGELGGANPGHEPDVSGNRVQSTAFSQTLARPIFFPGRRYPAPQVKVAAAPALLPPPSAPIRPAVPIERMKFHGVLIAGGVRKALIEASPGGIAWFGVGDTVEGWTISVIERNTVKLSNGPTTSSIALYSEKP